MNSDLLVFALLGAVGLYVWYDDFRLNQKIKKLTVENERLKREVEFHSRTACR